MNASPPKTAQRYRYGATYSSFQVVGVLILGYDSSTSYFTPSNESSVRGSSVNDCQFTGKERDAESGLDYFGARYYGSALGRFSSPDPSGLDFADPASPQSLNLYGYAWNNPLANLDPTGLSCVNLDNGGQSDDGDGKGCAGAGVKPGKADDPSTLNERQVNAEAKDKNPSDFDYLWTISTHEIPRYDPNDLPLDDRSRQIFILAYYRSAHDLGCIGLGAAVNGAGGAAVSLSQPRIPKPFSQGGNPNTSVARETFQKWTGAARGGPKLPAFEGGPGTGRAFKYIPTNSVGGVWARALPAVGLGLTAFSAYETYSCLSTTPQ